MQHYDSRGRVAVYSDAYGFGKPIDVHKEVKRKNIVLSKQGMHTVTSAIGDASQTDQALDFAQVLKECCKAYNISSDPNDYFLVPCLGLPTGTPNRNGVGFPLDQLTKWSVDGGCLAYRTWVNKPCYCEHENENPLIARGLILDTSLRKIVGFGNGKCYKVMFLQAFDRNKHERMERIISGDINTYSMGAFVGQYHCSYCGEQMQKDERGIWHNCMHLHPKQPKDFYVHNGRLVYRAVADIIGFENSSVEIPAYTQASGDVILPYASADAREYS
jgi:hypothetical protein